MTFLESCDPGVLIIAYRRADNVRKILSECLNSGINRIYITIDSPRSHEYDEIEDVQKVKDVISEFKLQTGKGIEIHSRAALRNLGCAVSVLSGCDWAFNSETELIVIEDDCIPSRKFFDFYRMYSVDINAAKNVYLVCGTQFAPNYLVGQSGLLSKYPLTWGWGTNRESWYEIRKIFLETKKMKVIFEDLFASTPESAYWRAAKRRALLGITDVWDSVVVEFMLRRNLLAVLPPRNFILNNGNDSVATNVPSDSMWTHYSTLSEFDIERNNLVRRLDIEKWIRENCYRIKFRHLFSTKVTLFLDLLFQKRHKFKSTLRERLLRADEFETIWP